MDDLGILIEVPAHSFERDAQSNILKMKCHSLQVLDLAGHRVFSSEIEAFEKRIVTLDRLKS